MDNKMLRGASGKMMPSHCLLFSTLKTSENDWIRRHIHYKICTQFTPKPDSNEDPPECYCGGTKSEHEQRAINNVPERPGEWDKDKHFSKHTGNYFGKIRFVDEDGTHQPDFVRISNNMMSSKKDQDQVINLLLHKWKLPQPKLLISVTGGAQNFCCSKELEKRFKRGLCKAAKSTDAWIFSGGTNTGVMKLVGEAVRGSSFGSQIVTIGIATWGIVKNRCQLRCQDDSHLARYMTKRTKIPGQRGAFLDPNHTHFLLADDGTQYSYGKEIEFRAKLEQRLSEHFTTDGALLPQICILVEGGPNSIRTVVETVKLKNPVIIIAGSGRAADVIAEAYKVSQPNEAFDYNGQKIKIRTIMNNDKLMEIIRRHFPSSNEGLQNTMAEGVKELFQHDRLLTIYELNDSREFDRPLLSAIIQGNSEGTSSLASMRLAITWNRPGLAKDLILPNNQFAISDKKALLLMSIVQNKRDFIQMMLDEDLDMKDLLTHHELATLYNDTFDKTMVCFKRFARMKKDENCDKLALRHIGWMMELILEGSFQSEFTKPGYASINTLEQKFENPYDVLVVYAVFVESQDMALLFWERCKTPITTALIASKMNKYLSNAQSLRLNRDEEHERQLDEWAAEFEALAVGTMNRVYRERNHQKELWVDVLTTKHENWGQLNNIDLAISTGAKTFVAQGAVQTHLTDMWLGQIHGTQFWGKILICGLLPLIGPLFIRFVNTGSSDEEMEEGAVAGVVQNDNAKQVVSEDMEMNAAAEDKNEVMDPGTDTIADAKLSLARKIYCFYTAPIVKFQYYCLTYMVFLGFYVYHLNFARPSNKTEWLKDQDEDWVIGRYTATEIFLIVFVISTLPVEITQIRDQIPRKVGQKVLSYLKDLFNIVDVLALGFFVVGWFVKLGGDERYLVPLDGGLGWSNSYHLCMIFSFLCYTLRIMQLFQIHPIMGPKVVMIFKMTIDLLFFFIIMAIFLAGYGVCSQALLNPNQNVQNYAINKTNSEILFSIFFRPYIHVFGELDLDGIQNDFKMGHCKTDTWGNLEEDCHIDELMNDTTAELHYYLNIFLFCLYLLIVNVLLLNLLIAIFSKTYEDVESDSKLVWSNQRAEMILEYKDFSPIPMPLSLLYHIVEFLYYLFTLCNPPKNKDNYDDIEGHIYRVSMIEAEGREDYMAERREGEEQNDTGSALKTIQEQLDQLRALVKSQESPEDQPAPQPRISAIDRPIVSKFDFENKMMSKKLTRIKPMKVHVDSRMSPYPGTEINRCIVPDDKVSWLVTFSDYKPINYTDATVLAMKGDNVDPVNLNKNNLQFNKLKVKTLDGKRLVIDRTSHHGKYNVIDGVPRNHKGRTGMVGRGSLLRWGPNHAADTVVTRWKRDGTGAVLTMDDKPVLEFVGVYRPSTNEWAIPGGRLKPYEKMFDVLKREFSEEALETMEGASDVEQKRIGDMLKDHFNLGITVYKGYVDDPRNTDNAWIETTAVNYHDSTGNSFSNLPIKSNEEGQGAQWIAIDTNLDLYANHEWIIEKVCYHRDAYNPIKTPKRQSSQLWLAH